MSVNLVKGQKVNLSKENAGLKRVMVGLGWDEAQQAGGFLGALFGAKKQDIDCDAIAFLLDANGKIAKKGDVVFFNNLTHSSGCVKHQGDNLTGAGEGDDEQILVDLKNLPSDYQRIVILVSIYQATQRKQHFGMIRNAFIRLVDADTQREICKYNLTEDYSGKTSLIFGELYRREGEWKFNAVGQPSNIWSVSELANQYGLSMQAWRS
jgi:Uncharacterized proteins involved in stress response, homologs of TerZ and putative cAMP-binding protein CABP1